MKKIHILFLFLIYTLLTNASTCSVIIPCAPCHSVFLKDLLNLYSQQTVLPDEIVISISQLGKVDKKIIRSIRSTYYPFSVKIIPHKNRLWASANRNSACANASGDIFLLQDADDIPHPQRVEIIKHIFSKYDFDHLIHCWMPIEDERPKFSYLSLYWGNYDISQIQVISISSWDHISEAPIKNFLLPHGAVAIRRKIFETHKWPNNIRYGEDQFFNKEVCNTEHRSAIVDAFLLIYRPQYSAH
jgi:glycosyltransferase involved in cell wall biosynthesis